MAWREAYAGPFSNEWTTYFVRNVVNSLFAVAYAFTTVAAGLSAFIELRVSTISDAHFPREVRSKQEWFVAMTTASKD